MKYLKPSFSIEPPKKLEGLGCPRCALGPKWGEHVKDCQYREPEGRVVCRGCGQAREVARRRPGMTEYRRCSNCGDWSIRVIPA